MSPSPPVPDAAPSSAAAPPAPRRRLLDLPRGVALLAVLGAGAYLLLRTDPAEPVVATASTGPLPVRVVPVELVDRFEIAERLAGRVISRRRSQLGFERNGRLARVLVREGDAVAAGDVLAELDTRELVAARREQAARIESTRARLALARVTAQRQRRLSESEYLSPQTLDEALAAEASLEAELAADRAALERTEVAISLSRLVAPYAARVARRHIDEGTVVGAGQTVLSVLESGALEVEIGVPPEVAVRLEVGARYTVENDTLELPARLRSVLPEIDRATRTQKAILEVETAVAPDPDADAPASAAPAAELADGALVWLRLARAVEARGAWVPIGALAEGRRGTWTAFAVVPDEAGVPRVDRRVVEILQTEELRAFVRGTLRDGDRLVADGLHRLAPGLAVRPVAAPEEA